MRGLPEAVAAGVPTHDPAPFGLPEGTSLPPPALASPSRNCMGSWGKLPRIYATSRLVIDSLGMSISLPRHHRLPLKAPVRVKPLFDYAESCVNLRTNYPKITHGGDVHEVRGGVESADSSPGSQEV